MMHIRRLLVNDAPLSLEMDSGAAAAFVSREPAPIRVFWNLVGILVEIWLDSGTTMAHSMKAHGSFRTPSSRPNRTRDGLEIVRFKKTANRDTVERVVGPSSCSSRSAVARQEPRLKMRHRLWNVALSLW